MTTNVGGGAETQPHCPPPLPVGARAARPVMPHTRTGGTRPPPPLLPPLLQPLRSLPSGHGGGTRRCSPSPPPAQLFTTPEPLSTVSTPHLQPRAHPFPPPLPPPPQNPFIYFYFPFLYPPTPQCDFFQRTRYYRVMPKYHAVRIRQEQRYPPAGPRRKKHWVTSWQQPDKYY